MVKILLIFLLLFSVCEKVSAETVETDAPYSYKMLVTDLVQLRLKYGNEIKIKSIGMSHQGRKIWAARLGHGKKSILLIGSHHGREWMTSMLLMKMLEDYAEAYGHLKRIGPYPSSLLDEVSIWFVPMLNPDGVMIQQSGLKGVPVTQRKQVKKMNEGKEKFVRWKANGLGVDLNRQYPAGWVELGQNPSKPSYQFFKGRKPLVSSETIALINFVKEINPLSAGAYHSAGREIFWEYHNGKNYRRDRLIAEKIAGMTGYNLGKPPEKAVGGGFTDWFLSAYHRPAFTIEISYLVGERNPPLSVFKEEWKRNRYVGVLLADEAHRLMLHNYKQTWDINRKD